MTLEDFFTLTEMKDGLRALSRVEELVTVIQKEKDCVVNPGDTIRQWTAVANIISATESKDCLDLFVQLGGLCFIDKWLKDGDDVGGSVGDSFVEELITTLLLALEKLCTDEGRSIDSIQPGICATLKNLFGHRSLRVQDIARKVFENLKLGDRDTISMENTVSENPVIGEGNCASDMPLSISNGIQTQKAEASAPAENHDGEFQPAVDTEGQILDLPESSVAANDVPKRVPDENGLQKCTLEETAASETDDGTVLGKENAGPTEASAAIEAVENDVPSSGNVSTESIADLSPVGTKVKVVNEGSNLCPEAAALLDLRASVTNSRVEKDDVENSSLSKDTGAVIKGKKLVRDGFRDFGSASILHTLGMDSKKSSKASDGNKRSVLELEYGIVDALEVARQVAQEVEKEMTDYKEPFCSSSSGRSSGDRIMKSSSPDSIERLAMEVNSEETSTGESQSVEAKPEEDDMENTEAEAKTEKGFCVFDLNEEVCTDDLECNEPRQERHGCLDIDLNMSEVVEDTNTFIDSKDSVNTGRSERPRLDLNSAGEDDDVAVVLEARMERQTFDRHDPSPSSSSSQFYPPQRNFDLNDRPLFDLPDQVPYQKPSPSSTVSFGRPRSDPFISIMGARVEVSRETPPPRAPLYHSNGNIYEPSGGVFGIGSGVSSLYTPLPRCNMLPPGHAISFSPPDDSAMMDPRVAPFISGPAGFAPIMLPPYSMPVMMNLSAGPSQPPLDLNSGFFDNGGTREQPGFFRQFLPPSNVDEHPGTFLQPLSGPVVGAKRKQPDAGWDFYNPITYGQQQQSPWK